MRRAGADVFDRLVDLGALDVERAHDGDVAALMPDRVTPDQVARALETDDIAVSPAVGRDADSVWVLTPPAVRVGTTALELIDSAAFGTGLHPTTALCLEALEEIVDASVPERALDVGTGSGVLALAALRLGVAHVTAIDADKLALRTAAENARRNGVDARLELVHGGPEAVAGTWPLVLANVLAAPLIEMAPAIIRRMAHHGELVLSGIPTAVEREVDRAYRHLGLRRVGARRRGGWVALRLRASW